MAVRIPNMSLVSFPHHKPKSPPLTSNRLIILAQAGSNTPKGSSPPIQIRSNTRLQKVFEDESSGVVCYKNDEGEIICEGYDEGPRLHQQSLITSSSSSSQREAIIDFLKRSLLQVIDGAGKVN